MRLLALFLALLTVSLSWIPAAMSQPPPQTNPIICHVFDDETVRCVTPRLAIEMARDRFGPAYIERLQNLLQRRAGPPGYDENAAAWLTCSQGDGFSSRLREDFARLPEISRSFGEPGVVFDAPLDEIAMRRLSERDVSRFRMACLSQLSRSMGASAASAGGRGYSGAIQSTKATMQQQIGSCATWFNQTVASGAATDVARVILERGVESRFPKGGPIVTAVVLGLEKYFGTYVPALAGAFQNSQAAIQDYSNVGVPNQPLTDDGAFTSYGKAFVWYGLKGDATTCGHQPGSEACDRVAKVRAQCNNGTGIHASCDALEEAGLPLIDSPPGPPAQQSPPSPTPTPPPPVPNVETSPDCAEENCRSSCEKRAAWWRRFAERCDRLDWSTYDCMSFVAALNNCPDPALINPGPDGNYGCHRRGDDEEFRRHIAQARCELQGRFARPEGEEFRCDVNLLADATALRRSIEERICWRVFGSARACGSGGETEFIAQADRTIVHRVKPGDTLSGLALRYYRDRAAWGIIQSANGPHLPNPNQLQIGDALLIPARQR